MHLLIHILQTFLPNWNMIHMTGWSQRTKILNDSFKMMTLVESSSPWTWVFGKSETQKLKIAHLHWEISRLPCFVKFLFEDLSKERISYSSTQWWTSNCSLETDIKYLVRSPPSSVSLSPVWLITVWKLQQAINFHRIHSCLHNQEFTGPQGQRRQDIY